MKKTLLVVLLLTLPAFAWLIQPGYFPMHDDLQTTRLMEMEKCFRDGQIPCRWVLDLGYGFGYPLFNFYPPLPYLVGLPFRFMGLAYIDAIKIVGILGFVLCALNMYLLGRQLWGKKGGIISSLVYTYAPYHSVDLYVRGAMNEFWAMAFFPAIFYSSYRLIKTQSFRYVLLLALSISGLMLSHNLMLLIFAPVAVVWGLFWLFKFKKLSAIIPLAISVFWGFGLSAFFTLPVLFEQKFAHVETLTIGYFNFLAHFLDLRQILFRINWGYGESILGSGDTMSFALGYLQWIIPGLVLLSLLFSKKLREHKLLIFTLIIFTLGALFFSHSKSTPFWLKFKPLQFLQFPWRLLTVAVFSASLVSGAIGKTHTLKWLSGLFVLILLLNANYFRPRTWYVTMTDQEKFSGKSWVWQITGSIFDYLPIWAPMPPADPAGGDLGITSGLGEYQTLNKKTNYQSYRLNIVSDEAIAEIQTFYFPGWRVWLDGREVSVDPTRDPLLGRMQVDVSAGSHLLEARFTDTPVRILGNVLSAVSWLTIILFAIPIPWTRKKLSVT
ncbi:hypothetical protein A2397_04065 [Candidatus Amesbacteria bacterium RIFOXYB1_FULL_44_23]|uniref:Membrane protein 6-pyruvoyl-tetrahydropterin synthase-related domain-containing protein n=1 Tax=Candidatus Amesbacteria bacterium RIFOXYB1_FULL_44_23 TaxID=1797263 RepID=A0A1F4ZSB7_9BACT|nr:MAG: hypothetical protein A2397_04065 [Candidatus Amesbacteria bacterium RIFOXYB1_FULL_44_23]